jgi:heme o synthase
MIQVKSRRIKNGCLKYINGCDNERVTKFISFREGKSFIKPYIELTKPRILFMVLITTAIGYFLALKTSPHAYFNMLTFFITLTGTALSCAGASCLNQYLERDVDRYMKRTMNRPLPTGQIQPNNALLFGVILVLIGTLSLAGLVNLLTGFLALLTNFLYVLVYTPLKRTTWLNTFIGAIPGALPPLGGWTAATNSASFGGLILFLILFLWQHPHFYAIAWMYKEDYKRAGFKMLPVVEPDGKSTFRQVIVYSVLLIFVSIIPYTIGMSGVLYLIGSLALGVFMLSSGVKLAKSESVKDARNLLKASVVYLPLLLMLIVFDVRI